MRQKEVEKFERAWIEKLERDRGQEDAETDEAWLGAESWNENESFWVGVPEADPPSS